MIFLSRLMRCFVILVAFHGGVDAAEVPVRDFARWRDFESAKISPQGEYLAMAKWAGDQKVIVIRDLKQGKFSGALKFAHGQSAADYWWVSPNRLIAEVAVQYGMLDQPYRTGELIAIDADGSHRDYLFGYRADDEVGSHVKRVTKEYASAFIADPLIHDAENALIAIWPWNRASAERTYPSLEKLDVRSGQRKRVDLVPLFSPAVLADRSGRPRLASGYGKNAVCCKLMARNPEDKDWKEIGDVAGNVDLYRVTRQDQSVIFASTPDAGPTCLNEYRFAEGSMTRLDCNGTTDVAEVTFSLDGQMPIAVRYEDGRPQTSFLEPEQPDARLLRALQKNFSGQRIRVTSTTTDGAKAVLLVDSDRNPGDFYLLDRATRKAAYLMSRQSWIDPAAMQPVEPISYQTRDGRTIHGYLTAAAGLQTRKAPLVLMPHGGPHGVRDFWEWDADAQLLASRGYSVLQANYRGSGGYGGAHESAGYRKWGTLMQDDLTDAVKWAIEQGIADPARVCIYGVSYGGYAAMMSAMREPDLYRCAATFAGVANLVTQGKDSDIADSWLGQNYLRRKVGDDDAELLAQSPVGHVARLKAAVLIAHGTEDRRVPISQAKELRAALEKNGKSYEWAEFSGEEHGFFKEENREAFYNKLLAFLDKHIGAARVAPAPPAQTTAP